MSNVLYVCPEEGCNSRLFDSPGGTKLKCRQHDKVFEQKEKYKGNLWQFVDESGKTHSRATGEVDESKLEDPAKRELTEQELKTNLRLLYEDLSDGSKPDLRWGIERLREEVKALREAKEEAEQEVAEEGEDKDEDADEETA